MTRLVSTTYPDGAPTDTGWRIMLWLACATLSACASHRTVEGKYEKIAAEIEPGDRVEIVTSDGEEISFRVTEVRETELVGDTSTDITTGKIVSVSYEDMKRLERVDQRPLVVIGSLVAVPAALLGVLLLILLAGGGAVMGP
jgi:hypothetical protein